MRLIQILLFVTASSSFGQILFEDEASLRGLDITTPSDGNGLGISFVDYDNDGLDDLTIPSRGNQELKFYKNFGGFFVKQDLILPPITYPTRSISWVDYDNDGDKDLFVVSDSHGNRLFNRNSSGNFVDVTLSSGLFTDNVFTYSVSWGDIQNDGCLDLFFSNRTTNTLFPNFLFKNNCDGTFTNVSSLAGISSESRLTFGASFFDYNKDGFQDIYLINDKSFSNRLYKNNGDSTFTDVSALTGAGITADAMSVTIDDYNSDGFLDIYITNTDIIYADSNRIPGNILLKNVDGNHFEDVSAESSVDLFGWCWGANFLDADNDSDLDLYVSCLYVTPPSIDSYGFFENSNLNQFHLPSSIAFLQNNYNSYGCAVGDVNSDGKVDIAVINDSASIPNIWINKTLNDNNYLAIDLEGTAANKDGVGSLIEVTISGDRQYRYILNGEGYISQNSFIEYFGLGDASIVDELKITWLSGTVDIFYNIAANQTLNIVEGSSSTLSANGLSREFLHIYPNPAIDTTNISSYSIINTVILYNSFGQEVYSKEVNSKSIKLDLLDFMSGIYFLKISTDKSTIVKKIIKQ
ncbi:FG-GAP-like repeat-containing protein [Winogradskyella wandonensis]|nr:FG-GAP-like repeat-containing protein [Winogradskyella wandonensis]